MQLTPSDPDIATLYRRIENNRLDLQPNFQRGEVWGRVKKQRLIDSILRKWHIPPVHIIEANDKNQQEVLDGQQRLAAIRDFMQNKFPIKGNQEPIDPFIENLNGFFWKDLSKDIQSEIEEFTIRVLTISNYRPGEPGELFYRLNQPTNLTSAEQRNAFYGEARQQVKDLSKEMVSLGINRDLIGFSNSRMAYDDVIAKTMIAMEQGNLNKKITANTVTTRYRESNSFPNHIYQSTLTTIGRLHDALTFRNRPTKLNKATFFTWAIFIYAAERDGLDPEDILGFFDFFETIKNTNDVEKTILCHRYQIPQRFVESLMNIYQDRASSRVADTSSVILRNMITWLFFAAFKAEDAELQERTNQAFRSLYSSFLNKSEISEKHLLDLAKKNDWSFL